MLPRIRMHGACKRKCRVWHSPQKHTEISKIPVRRSYDIKHHDKYQSLRPSLPDDFHFSPIFLPIHQRLGATLGWMFLENPHSTFATKTFQRDLNFCDYNTMVCKNTRFHHLVL